MDKLPPELLLHISDHLEFYDQMHLKCVNKLNYETVEIKQFLPYLLICRDGEVGITNDCYPECFIEIKYFKEWCNKMSYCWQKECYNNQYILFVLVGNKPVRIDKNWDIKLDLRSDGTLSMKYNEQHTFVQIINKILEITNLKLTMPNSIIHEIYNSVS